MSKRRKTAAVIDSDSDESDSGSDIEEVVSLIEEKGYKSIVNPCQILN